MIIYADGHDITSAAGNLTWKNSVAELATIMDFSIAKSAAQHTNIYTPAEGSVISLVTNTEIFRGIVLTADDGDIYVNSYTACDFAFYLNENSETYQFDKMPVNDLLRKVCRDFKIEIDSICEIKHAVTKIYMDKAISEIIDDVLEGASKHTGYAYNYDMTPKGLRVYRLGDYIAYPEFRLSANTRLLYSPELRGSTSHSVSIEDMKNAVKVITGSETAYQLRAVARNDVLINQYGLLQTVEKIEDKEIGNADFIAKSKLKELSVKKETHGFEMIEAIDSYTKAGYELTLSDGVFIIESTEHSIRNGMHFVNLDLRRVRR